MEREQDGPPLVPEIPAGAVDVRPRLWVLRPVGPQGILVVSLSPRLYRYGVHYVPQLTADRGCRGSYEMCHWCRDGYDFREKFYLAALLAPKLTLGLLELTAGAVAHCRQLGDTSRNWRGMEIKAWRLGRKSNSPECVQVGARRTDLNLPSEPDVYQALLRYWGEADHRARPAAEGGGG